MIDNTTLEPHEIMTAITGIIADLATNGWYQGSYFHFDAESFERFAEVQGPHALEDDPDSFVIDNFNLECGYIVDEAVITQCPACFLGAMGRVLWVDAPNLDDHPNLMLRLLLDHFNSELRKYLPTEPNSYIPDVASFNDEAESVEEVYDFLGWCLARTYPEAVTNA